MCDDLVVAGCAWFDDFAREEICIDYGEVVWRRGEDGGYGGFAGGDGAGET